MRCTSPYCPPPNLGKPGADRTGVEIWGLAPALPESVNCQRATIQAPQGLDGKHSGELFPVGCSSSRQRTPALPPRPRFYGLRERHKEYCGTTGGGLTLSTQSSPRSADGAHDRARLLYLLASHSRFATARRSSLCSAPAVADALE